MVSPNSTDMLPSALAIVRAELGEARRVSTELQKAFKALSREVEPDLEPDEAKPEPNPKTSLMLASLGIELASKKKEVLLLERHVVSMQQDGGMLHPETAEKRLQALGRGYVAAGDDLWRHQMEKMRLDDPGTVRLLDPRSMPECLLALYKKSDGLDKKKKEKRPSKWREDALAYYGGEDVNAGYEPPVWCHISGEWHIREHIEAARIVVPFFSDTESFGEMLFGSRAQSLERAGNALLLSNQIKAWFDSYHLVVVPVDATETPITRWRTDIISPHIRNSRYSIKSFARDLDGKELVFLNKKRPVSRFLYFHFIIALVRIKDLNRRGWQDIWARYYEQRPFPAPGNYMRQSMLFALATHFETTHMSVVESWIADHGFDSPFKLTDDEAVEAARRIHEAVEQAVSRSEEDSEEESEESEEDEEDEE